MYTLIGFTVGMMFAIYDRRFARALLPLVCLGMLTVVFVKVLMP